MDAVGKLAEHGTLGIICAILMYVIIKLYTTLETERNARSAEVAKGVADRTAKVEEVQLARVDDAKAYQSQLVTLLTAATTAITQSASSANATKEALGELKDSFDKFTAESRRGRT